MPKTVDRKMVRSWTEELEALNECLSEHFARSEVRQRAQDYLRRIVFGNRAKERLAVGRSGGQRHALRYSASARKGQLGR